jgi:hypothetical protein
MMEALRSSETSALTRTTQRNIAEDCILYESVFQLRLLVSVQDER